MTKNYVDTPKSISFNTVVENNYTLSSSQYKDLTMKNQIFLYVRDFLSRPLERSDLGEEVGSVNYIQKSPFYFIRTKALQEHTYLPEITQETTRPVMPKVFKSANLKQGDILISKDSNIGEIAILDKDYPNYMLSGAIYKLPLKKRKYYLLAFIKHPIFRQQLDYLVPKGATIRHAKTLFLDCKIPLPNKNVDNTIAYVEVLMQAIINKEKLIRDRHEIILQIIEDELVNNQNVKEFVYEYPRINEVKEIGRLDTGLFNYTFKKYNRLVVNYINGSKNLIERGFEALRGTSLEGNFIKTRIDSDKYIKGFYELVLPTNISQYGYVEKSTYIGTPTQLKTISQGDIIFGGEGFGKGRTFVVCESTKNIATNYHGIRIINTNNNLIESIFIRCFLAYWRSKKMIDFIGVGGSGGHCAPSYFHLINTPLFPQSKQEEIAQLYHNKNVNYAPQNFTLDSFLTYDNSYNETAGIYELDKTIKQLKARLNEVIDNIVKDKDIEIKFLLDSL